MKRSRFVRQESWRLRRVKPSWRRPRGVTSRMRKEKGGWPQKAKVGHGTGRSSKGLHPRGLSERLVERVSDLEGLDARSHIVRFSARLGEKKRLLMVERARELGLRVANPGTSKSAGREGEAVVEEPGSPVNTRAISGEEPEKRSSSEVEEAG